LVLGRRIRSHAMFEWFARIADTVLVFDNTEQSAPAYAAGKSHGQWSLHALGRLPDDMAHTIRALARPPAT
jgi:hypothetical protein